MSINLPLDHTEADGAGQNIGSEYRMERIKDIESYLEAERKKQEKLRRKYVSAHSALGCINTGASTGAAVFGIGAVITLGTGCEVVITAPIAAMAGVMSITTLATKGLRKIMHKNIDKHEQLNYLAFKKVEVVSKIVSTALTDGVISDEELKLVLVENRKYIDTKKRIRRNFQKEVNKFEEELDEAIRDKS